MCLMLFPPLNTPTENMTVQSDNNTIHEALALQHFYYVTHQSKHTAKSTGTNLLYFTEYKIDNHWNIYKIRQNMNKQWIREKGHEN